AEDRAAAFLRAVATAARNTDLADCDNAVRTTAAKVRDGESATGWPKLIEMIGEHGPKVVQAVCGWLRIEKRKREDDGQGRPRKPAAPRLGELALEPGLDLFHGPDQTGYAVVLCVRHRETWSLTSTGFKRWLCRLFYQMEERSPGGEAVASALGVLQGKAL